MENLFENIIDRDEQIIKTIKPNHTRFVVANIVIGIVLAILLGAPMIVGGLLSALYVWDMNSGGWAIFGSGIFLVVIMLLPPIIMYPVRYSKTVYAYTNKRLIIRTGFIGIDYRSLDYKNLGSTDVKVGFLDKLIKKNTGTIVFGSSSSPMIGGYYNQRYGVLAMFSFAHIDDPYVLFREIKERIAESNTVN